MILVCGGLADAVTEVVCARLGDCGYAYRLLDLGTYPSQSQVTWRWGPGGPEGYVAGSDWRTSLDELSGVFARYPGPEGRVLTTNLTSDLSPALYAEHDSGLMALLDDLPCAVANRTGGGMSNNSKAYQAQFVRQSGLRVPPTLVTNDPDIALAFWHEFGEDVIYKSLSGIRSVVRRVNTAQLARLPLLRHTPAQFQAYVPGDNVRVHTVGDKVFATRVISSVVDYRYARESGSDVTMEPMDLPADVEASCRRLARGLGLLLTGIDLKQTPEGEYYCFEVNPSPGFLYYERNTGQPISLALAELLRTGQDVRQEDEMLPVQW